MTKARDISKLSAVEADATADQTNAEVKAAVEAASDSNTFTDADHSKLNAIEASADVTDTANVTSSGALMDSELTNLAAVKAINQSLVTTADAAFASLDISGNIDVDGVTNLDVVDIDGAVDMASTLTVGGPNVGIGTSSFTTTDGSNIELSSSSSARVILDSTGGSGRKWTMATGTTGSLDFYDYDASSYRMRIASSGNVGIGTSSPSAKLHVANAATEEYIFETTNNSTRSQVEVKSKDSSGNAVQTRIASIGDGVYGMLYTLTNHNLSFATNNAAPQMTLDTSGNVGIGTGSPDCRLHSVEATNNSSSTGLANGGLQIENTNTTTGSWSQLHLRSVAYDAHLRLLNDGTLRIMTDGNTSAMTITDAGNVGIGTSSPSTMLHIENSSGNASAQLTSGTSGTSYINMGDTGNVDAGQISYINNGDAMAFTANAAERMRIDSSGQLIVGGTAPVQPSKVGIQGGSSVNRLMTFEVTHTTAFGVMGFHNGNGIGGSISLYANSVSFNTSSDYRLKTDIQPMMGATDRVKLLKPCNFAWISDGTRVDGFIAHEAQAVVPEAVTGTKDEVDDNGDAVMQGIDQSKLVPLLVKTIQELEARITILEA